MPDRLPPARGYDLSDYQLGRASLYGPIRDFLKHYATRDRVSQFIDFSDWGDAASFTVAQTQTSVNFTVVDGIGGVMAGTAVAVTTASISAIGKTRWNGNSNCMFEARFKVDTVASTFIVEAGWISAAPATGANVVTDIDVPSFNTGASNAALFVFANNQTHTSVAFASIGSFTSQTVASTLVTAATNSFTTPVADTYMTVNILLLTNPGETGKSKMFGWLNGKRLARHEAAAGAVNGQTPLYPWLYLQAVGAAAKIMTVDYVWLEQDRSALGVALE